MSCLRFVGAVLFLVCLSRSKYNCSFSTYKRLKLQVTSQIAAIRDLHCVIEIKNQEIQKQKEEVNDTSVTLNAVIATLRAQAEAKDIDLADARNQQQQSDRKAAYLRNQLFARCALFHRHANLSVHTQIAMMSQEMEKYAQDKQSLGERVLFLEQQLREAQRANMSAMASRLRQSQQEFSAMQLSMQRLMNSVALNVHAGHAVTPCERNGGARTGGELPTVPRSSRRNTRKRGQQKQWTPWRKQWYPTAPDVQVVGTILQRNM